MPNKRENGPSAYVVLTSISRCAPGKKSAIFALCTISALNVDTAMADSVNGIWCSPDGRQIEISYEGVTLNDGNEVYGDYDRHHYVFRMPPDGVWAGATVDMVLRGQDVVIVRYISGSGVELLSEPEKWIRCQAGVN